MTAFEPMLFAEIGACRGADQTIFFPVHGDRIDVTEDELAAANTFCNGCPVRIACHDWALHHETEGIWAGTTPRQRRRTRRALGLEDPTPPDREQSPMTPPTLRTDGVPPATSARRSA